MRKALTNKLAPFAVFFSFLSLYLITANQLFSFDAITNAIACEVSEPVRWFHGNHPLYPFVGVLWYKLEKLLGYNGYSIYSLARFNSVLMAGALAIFCHMLITRVGALRSFLLTLCLGFSYAVWAYAVDGRAIGASVIFSMLVIFWLLKLDEEAEPRAWHLAVLAVFSSLTVLMHAIAVFHCVAVAIWLWRKNLKNALVYISAVIGLVGATYVGCFLYVSKSGHATTFLAWAAGYAGFNGVGEIGQSGFWGRNLSDILDGLWRGWRNAFFAPAETRFHSVIAAAASLIILGAMLAGWLGLRHSPAKRSLVIALIGWGALIMFFLAFWSPGQEGFRLHALSPWFAATALCLGASRWINWTLLILGSLLFFMNFMSAIYPASFIQNNQGFQVLSFLEGRLVKGDVLISGPNNVLPDIEVLRPYFFPELSGGSIAGRLFAFRETSLDPLAARLSTLLGRGHAVYLTEDLFNGETQRKLDRICGLNEGSVEAFVSGFDVKGDLTLPNGRKLYSVVLTSR